MDQRTLVADGLTILRLLAKANFSLKASALTYSVDRGWRLILAPERYDGPREVYGRLVDILDLSSNRLRQLTLSDISIVEPDSDFASHVLPYTFDRAKSYDGLQLGREYFQQVITLPVRVAAPAVNHRGPPG